MAGHWNHADNDMNYLSFKEPLYITEGLDVQGKKLTWDPVAHGVKVWTGRLKSWRKCPYALC